MSPSQDSKTSSDQKAKVGNSETKIPCQHNIQISTAALQEEGAKAETLQNSATSFSYLQLAHFVPQHFQQPDRSLRPIFECISHVPHTHATHISIRNLLTKQAGIISINARTERQQWQSNRFHKLLDYHMNLCKLRVGCMLDVLCLMGCTDVQSSTRTVVLSCQRFRPLDTTK